MPSTLNCKQMNIIALSDSDNWNQGNVNKCYIRNVISASHPTVQGKVGEASQRVPERNILILRLREANEDLKAVKQ